VIFIDGMINIFDLTPVLIVISCITCVGASSREILKAPNEKCPEGYHVLDGRLYILIIVLTF